MSEITLESEDLENVPLVRMEDVQPSRERTYEASRRLSEAESDEEVLETCVIEDIEYDEYIVNNDEDSNIGSMVSIKSEDVAENSDAEMIVPEIVDDIVTNTKTRPPEFEKLDLSLCDDSCEYDLEESKTEEPIAKEKPKILEFDKLKPESSWPTLEILPGGVIKKPAKEECNFDEDFCSDGEMMYACAKCPQRFKFLFCLVKHVKWHENEDKKLRKIPEKVIKTTPCNNQATKLTNKQIIKIKRKDRKLTLVMKGSKKKLKDLKS